MQDDRGSGEPGAAASGQAAPQDRAAGTPAGSQADAAAGPAEAGSDASPGEVTEITARRIAELRTGEEGQEGLGAFLEKREPAWREES